MPGGRTPRPLPSLRFRRIRSLVLLVGVITIGWAGVHAVRSGDDAAAAQSQVAADPAPSPPPTAESAAAALVDTVGRRTAGVAGRTSVSVTDLSTGVSASYGALDQQFTTASIVKVDILATLLLQKEGKLSDSQKAAARRMIQESSNGAASTLWRQIGKATGLAAANQQFGLTATTGGKAGYWGSTTTTAADQQRLLHIIFTDDSPLDAGSRTYLKSLMGGVVADQDWGVTAADTRPGAKSYVKNGWLPRSGGWVVNSIGAVEHGGHNLLIVALSDGRASKLDGVQVLELVAADAAQSVSGV